MVDGISQNTGDCVVRNDHWLQFWLRGDQLSGSPLAKYIQENFVP
jgi:hypothetical protein